MSERQYFSMRSGKNPNLTFDFPAFLEVSIAIFHDFDDRGYLQEAFGYYCVDAHDFEDNHVPGTLGRNVDVFIMRKLRKRDLWPVWEKYSSYSEDDLFDIIEFLFDYVSKPTNGYFHSYNGCGWHYQEFDRESGKHEFRLEVNSVLRDYGGGYELSTGGEIFILGPIGTEMLLEADLPLIDVENVNQRVIGAVRQFRSYRSSVLERRDAVRNLGDVLEFLRPQLKEVLKDDESDLFNILNNFGIRHHNDRQKTQYEEAIFLSWLFYHYLAAIHAALRLIEKRQTKA